MTVVHQDPARTDPPRSESIEELFAALESPLLIYALRLLGERSLAEDVVQDAFMKLHAQFAEVREPRRWLYRTVHNQALNQRRDSAKIVAWDPSPDSTGTTPGGVDSDPIPDEHLMRSEGIGLVRLSLATLDARSRELVRLKFNENLSYKEISARTGLTGSHVGYLLHHALKNVAAELVRTGLLP